MRPKSMFQRGMMSGGCSLPCCSLPSTFSPHTQRQSKCLPETRRKLRLAHRKTCFITWNIQESPTLSFVRRHGDGLLTRQFARLASSPSGKNSIASWSSLASASSCVWPNNAKSRPTATRSGPYKLQYALMGRNDSLLKDNVYVAKLCFTSRPPEWSRRFHQD